MLGHNMIYLIHMLIVCPILMYPLIAQKYFNVTNYDSYFVFIAIIGLVVLLYHAYKLYELNKY